MRKIRDTSGCSDKELESAKKALHQEFVLKQILGKSKVIQELHKKINLISSCDASVLITGESGTGKELVARTIHYLSNRKSKPFIPINCGAIPENLFENELYGHAKGAFTGALSQQAGLVKEAESGTLFLDEVGTISPYIQVKLLRLLQDKEYKLLGDSKIHKADVRMIAATNQPLRSLVKNGGFREDLFYRLNVVSLYIPPLRDRKEDIPVLLQRFMHKYSAEYKKPVKEFSKDAMDYLTSYHWPGNVREMENKIQQIIIMSVSPTITAKTFQLALGESNAKDLELELFKVAKKKTINTFEKKYLVRLLIEHNGEVVSCAKRSGHSRTALWNLFKKHNLSPKKYRF